jgi:hypothetical protein
MDRSNVSSREVVDRSKVIAFDVGTAARSAQRKHALAANH